jgi:hypothetical protein
MDGTLVEFGSVNCGCVLVRRFFAEVGEHARRDVTAAVMGHPVQGARTVR